MVKGIYVPLDDATHDAYSKIKGRYTWRYVLEQGIKSIQKVEE